MSKSKNSQIAELYDHLHRVQKWVAEDRARILDAHRAGESERLPFLYRIQEHNFWLLAELEKTINYRQG